MDGELTRVMQILCTCDSSVRRLITSHQWVMTPLFPRRVDDDHTYSIKGDTSWEGSQTFAGGHDSTLYVHMYVSGQDCGRLLAPFSVQRFAHALVYQGTQSQTCFGQEGLTTPESTCVAFVYDVHSARIPSKHVVTYSPTIYKVLACTNSTLIE